MQFLEEIRGRLQAFVEQRDAVALILLCSDSDAAPLLKILEGLEEGSQADLYWSFTCRFSDADSYAGEVFKEFAARHTAVRLAMKDKMTPWPPLPDRLQSDELPPSERLRRLAAFSRELSPAPNAGNNVWVFFPLEIADAGRFAALMQELIRHEFPFPWCHHLRFIVRQDPSAQELGVRPAPRVQFYQPDLSMEAVTRSLEAQTADETLPLEQRMAPLPVLAGNDFAQGRYPEAMEKYELLLRYHAPMNNYSMAAFALNGMGETYERSGDLERAQESYLAALVPASHGQHPALPVFLNIVRNLANLSLRQEKWEDGEGWYDAAQQLATAARNAPVKIDSLDQRGFCQQQQGKQEEAAQSWQDALVIAAQLQDVGSCRMLLGRLEQHYTATGDSEKARSAQEQLAGLKS
jgi:tetratricopeptide (TPR) repeat protein